MKTGMNLLLWATHVTAEHFPILAKLKKTGFDGVEVPLFEGDVNYYKTIRKELDNHGLRCTTVTCVGPDHNPISADAKVRAAALERLKWAIDGLADSFVHVHISENDRGTPGTGHVHWDETFKALRKLNYDGWLTIEAFGRALPDLAAATRVWRDLFPAAEEVYTQGLRFMKEKWASTVK